MSRAEQHDALSALLKKSGGAFTNTLQGGVSSHASSTSISVETLKFFFAEASTFEGKSLLGSRDNKLLLAHNFNFSSEKELNGNKNKKKRGSDELFVDEAVEKTVKKVVDKLEDGSKVKHVLDSSRSKLHKLLALKSAENASILESYALLYTCEPTERLVLVARFSPGAALPLSSLLQVIGKNSDGMVTTEPPASLAPKLTDLSLTENGRAAEKLGQRSFCLLLTVFPTASHEPAVRAPEK